MIWRALILLLSAALLTACATGSEGKTNHVAAAPNAADQICACLKEKRDLWLCGMADEPSPPYNAPNRRSINNVLIKGAMIGVCVTESESDFLDPSIEDPITPSSISHEFDDFTKDGELLQQYNYLVYEFEKDGKFLRAHSYLDEIDRVSIFCPIKERSSIDRIEAPEFEQQVIDYLKRRYTTILLLSTAWSPTRDM